MNLDKLEQSLLVAAVELGKLGPDSFDEDRDFYAAFSLLGLGLVADSGWREFAPTAKGRAYAIEQGWVDAEGVAS